MSSDAGGAPPARKTVAALADLPLRRGKWTTDEQNYSELLIQYFLAGVVPDCADGTTLRAFLSARLHCAPMRITKKFAGATLGKSIFYRTGHLDEPELWRLRRLESLFVRAEETTSAEAIFFAMRGAAQRSGEVVEHPGPGASKRPRPEDAADDADGPSRPSAWALKRLDASSEDGARAAPGAEGLPPPNPRERVSPAAGAFLVPLRVGRGMTPGTVIEMSLGGAKYRAVVPAGAVEGQTVTLPSSALARVPDPAATPAAAPPALPAPGSPRVVFRGSPW